MLILLSLITPGIVGKMKKIVILQNKILHYRKPLYNMLSIDNKVCVIHSGQRSRGSEDYYDEVILPAKQLGPFYFQPGLRELLKDLEFDVIISMCDFHWPFNIISYFLFNRKKVFIWWGLNVGKAGYFSNKLKAFIGNRRCPIVAYSTSAAENLQKYGLDRNKKIHVANNTFHVADRHMAYLYEKKDLLFVGSLDKRKQLDVLLFAFKNVLKSIPHHINLIIVGSGEEKESIQKKIKELNLLSRIQMKRAVNNEEDLWKLYKNAIVSISFGQAGLSVLQSFAFGVPFLTKYNAITGGEIVNIINHQNGVLCGDSLTSLEGELVKFCSGSYNVIKMGQNAYDYYTNNCTMQNMVKVFNEVIKLESTN